MLRGTTLILDPEAHSTGVRISPTRRRPASRTPSSLLNGLLGARTIERPPTRATGRPARNASSKNDIASMPRDQPRYRQPSGGPIASTTPHVPHYTEPFGTPTPSARPPTIITVHVALSSTSISSCSTFTISCGLVGAGHVKSAGGYRRPDSGIFPLGGSSAHSGPDIPDGRSVALLTPENPETLITFHLYFRR